MKLLYLISFLFTIIITFTWANAQLCNGYAELCNKSYSSVSFVATHNSYAYGANVAATQNYDIPTQLKDGVRAFLLAALSNPNPSKSTDIELCHTSCDLLDSGTVANTLKNFTTFLQNNPNEVVTIFWRNFFSNLTVSDFKTAFDKAGLTRYCFTQPLGAPWPTMADIIKSGKRVINFLDSGADNKTVPWLMSEYSYVFETPYDNSDPNSWPCTIDRPEGQSRPLYMINHFLYTVLSSGSIEIEIPSRSIVNTTNGASLQTQAQNCTKIFGKAPNFIAVDFYDEGSKNTNVFSVIANFNGVPYVPTTYGNGILPYDVSKTNNVNIIKPSLSTAIVSLLMIFIFVVVEL
ncbi:PLC-like phosphodiesterase [Gigaspora rosea]|uniref:PLC-like phosphodiesterase n=1 Tax=Gigaspora rosea TaxID=44941 RepID=A0A397V8G5_9GLOM|nr:PLC-like phosphodiesterase [Gigaspora rosea]